MSVDWRDGDSSLHGREGLYRLPPQPHAMIGRQRDLKAAEALILREDVRLVTVVGPPGVGKTRFAVELASRVASKFDQGVVFVDLAPLRDAGLVLDLVARALGVAEHLDRPVLAQLERRLRHQNLLLILDNLEHLIAAAANLADLLEVGSRFKLLVTSRQPLHVRWEHRYNLFPLALPDAPTRLSPDALARYPATALFMERVRTAEASFSVGAHGVPAVVEICRRLDGLPLAIELAAAWTAVLGPEAVLSRLSDHHRAFPLGSARDASERQRTLYDAIAWSYDLLNEAERRVFRALGAFAGETPLEAIEAVCEGLGVDVLTPVAGLVDKNLLLRVGEGETRFRMLETIRSFAGEQLEHMGEADGVRQHHAKWFLGLARRAERFIWSEHQAVWIERLEQAHDNVRLALNWCFSGGDAETGALLVASMHRFLFARGYIREGRRWGEQAASKQVSDQARALVLRNLAFFMVYQSEVEQAIRLAEQAAALARSVGEPALLAWVLHGLALATDALGDIERSERLNREILNLARRAGDEALAIRALGGIGSALQSRGDHAQARAFFEEALALARPRHDKWLTSVVTGNLGLALASHDPAHAQALLEESLALSHEIGHRWLTVRRLEDLAGLQAASRPEVAAKLLGACESLRDAFGFAHGSSSEAMVSTIAATARERLGPAAFEAARSQGRAMMPGEAVALALGWSAPAPIVHTQRPGGLTEREVQIVREIAGGLTNRQIAQKLEISQRTVDAHVQNILNKLGMEKRTQIAVWASRHLGENSP